MNILETDIKEISNNVYGRVDFKFINGLKKHKSESVPLGKVFDVINGISLEKYYVEEDTSIKFIKIGDLQDYGVINYNGSSFIDEEVTIPEEKVLIKDDIILATIGSVGKTGFFDYKGDIKFVASSNMVILRVKNKKKDNVKFYAKLFQTSYFKEYFNNMSSIKEQPNLQPYDLYNIKLPQISIDMQNKILEEMAVFENKYNINDIPLDSEIINDFIIKEFNIPIKQLINTMNNNFFVKRFDSLKNENKSLRCSYRWNKLEELQDIIFSNVKEIEKLGKYIISTKNGWSPKCNDEVQEVKVIGIDAINRNGTLKFDNIKYSSETRNNIEDFYIKKDELFLSRGNTVDLVGMAAVSGHVEEEIIYPDLMIKVSLNDEISKKYVAYIINSIIGRTYFKYVSKGKNISMVKISSDEIKELPIPIISKDKQEKICNEIDLKLIENEKTRGERKKNIEKEEKLLISMVNKTSVN